MLPDPLPKPLCQADGREQAGNYPTGQTAKRQCLYLLSIVLMARPIDSDHITKGKLGTGSCEEIGLLVYSRGLSGLNDGVGSSPIGYEYLCAQQVMGHFEEGNGNAKLS